MRDSLESGVSRERWFLVSELECFRYMLDELAFLIKGYDGVSDSRRKFVWLCRMFEVCREKPIRIRGKRVHIYPIRSSLSTASASHMPLSQEI